MKVGILVSADFPPKEGIGFYVWNLSRNLTKQGCSVHIITRGGSGKARCEIVDDITIWRPFYAPVYPLHVHLHSIWVNRLLRGLQGGLDVLHIHTPLVKFPKTNLPTLVTVHTPIEADAGSMKIVDLHTLLIKLQTPVSVGLERDLFRRADKLTAVAKSVAFELSSYGVDPRRVAVLGNGVDTDIFYPAPPKDVVSTPYILTAGRLGARKGLEDLLHCAKIVVQQYPHVQFWIAGNGPFQARLEHQIEQLGLGKVVRLLGHIADRIQMAELYRGATAYLHAAHYEGLPTVLLEGMACGRPAITTAVSGALDVIDDGENGLLVPAHDPKAMADAVLRILKEPKLGRQLGHCGFVTIRERYNWDAVSHSYASLYQEITGRGLLE